MLSTVDGDRLVYIPGEDGKAEPAAFLVHLRHVELGIPGISIPDDVAILPDSMRESMSPYDATNGDR